jgi:hypothetical protein
MIASLQAMYAGTPQGLATYLEPYINAGLEHAVLRVADTPERGLRTAAHAVRTLSVAIPAADDAPQNARHPAHPNRPARSAHENTVTRTGSDGAT